MSKAFWDYMDEMDKEVEYLEMLNAQIEWL